MVFNLFKKQWNKGAEEEQCLFIQNLSDWVEMMMVMG